MNRNISCDDLIGPSALYRSLPFDPSVIFPFGTSDPINGFFSRNRKISESAWKDLAKKLRSKALVISARNGRDAADACEFLSCDDECFGFRLADDLPADDFATYLCSSTRQDLFIICLSGSQADQRQLQASFDYEGVIRIAQPCYGLTRSETHMGGFNQTMMPCATMVRGWLEYAPSIHNWVSVRALLKIFEDRLRKNQAWQARKAVLRSRSTS